MTVLRILSLLALVLFSGCASYPHPDPSLIAYGRADPEKDAHELARVIYGGVWRIDGTSMLPFLVADDLAVGDFTQLFDWITPGAICLYDPNWADASIPFVIHMAVEKSGDAWIMTGLNNAHSEAGARAMKREDYRARVVQVFTRRAKP